MIDAFATHEPDSSRIAAEYDALPYPSFPYAYLHPGRLAALAVLHGLKPAQVPTARVLELGCAAGGNLIPLAVQFPSAKFVGIDISSRQVEDGRRRAATMGMTNLDLVHGDIAQLRPESGGFDYILCHGVFSWVSQAAQQALLRVASASLAPNGILAISYNVLPGWHLRSVVRDLCLLHAGLDGQPHERVARARRGLAATAAALRSNEPYPALLRAEAERLAAAPDAYLQGEFLAEHNTALHFHEFAAQASAHGLAYLCEGSLATSRPEFLMPAAASQIRAAAGGDPVALERHLDVFSGRRFRRSLLVKAVQAEKVDTRIALERVGRLHFASPVQAVPAASGAAVRSFTDGKGRAFTLKDRVVADAIARLAASYPSTATLKELCAHGGHDARTVVRIGRALLRLLSTGRAAVTSTPLYAGSADAERPRVWSLARLEASQGQPWVTGQNHIGVPPTPEARLLMPQLDGTRDAAWMCERVAAARASGAVPGNAASVEAQVRAALAFMHRHALLDG